MKRFKLLIRVMMIVGIVALHVGCKGDMGGPDYDTVDEKYTTIFVRGGDFLMGATTGSGILFPAQSGQEVNVRPFLISEHETTQKQWMDVMGTWPADAPDGTYGLGDDYPVYNVSWYDAIRFCNALSSKDGLVPYYTIGEGASPRVSIVDGSMGYRLPSEAEWEYAAKGGVHQSADEYAGTNDISKLEDYAWYYGNSSERGGVASPKTHPVGKKKGNDLGIKDMSGNVFEWCWDEYTDSDDDSDTVEHILRGGGFLNAELCRVAARSYYTPSFGYYDLGIRVVRSIEL